MDVLRMEEERFFETLENGMEILDTALAGGAKVLPGEVAFKLHDTYRLSALDLSADVCPRKRDVTVDEAGFHAAMDKQKAAGRAAGKFKMDKRAGLQPAQATPVQSATTKLDPTRQGGGPVQADGAPAQSAELKADQNGVVVVLDTTPFYSEIGRPGG